MVEQSQYVWLRHPLSNYSKYGWDAKQLKRYEAFLKYGWNANQLKRDKAFLKYGWDAKLLKRDKALNPGCIPHR